MAIAVGQDGSFLIHEAQIKWYKFRVPELAQRSLLIAFDLKVTVGSLQVLWQLHRVNRGYGAIRLRLPDCEHKLIRRYFKHFAHLVIVRCIGALECEDAILVGLEVDLGELSSSVEVLPKANNTFVLLQLLQLLALLGVNAFHVDGRVRELFVHVRIMEHDAADPLLGVALNFEDLQG